MTTENTVYIWSGRIGGFARLMYIQNVVDPLIGAGKIGSKLSSAMIFKTRQEAEMFQFKAPASGWQIQPTTRKEIFKAVLSGE